MAEHRHFILYKPVGYLSQFVFNQNKRRNKKLLGELYPFPSNTMAIGRLDKNSEGLLLLTTDGRISEAIRSHAVDKEYYVEVDGEISQTELARLEAGVEIRIYGKAYDTLPSKARLLQNLDLDKWGIIYGTEIRHRKTTWISITIGEGKFRQVRKMTAAVGYPTLRLIRVRIGNVTLGALTPGEVVEVKELNY